MSADDQMEPVVGAQAHIGDEQIGRRGLKAPFGLIEARGARDKEPCRDQNFFGRTQTIVIGVDDEQAERHMSYLFRSKVDADLWLDRQSGGVHDGTRVP